MKFQDTIVVLSKHLDLILPLFLLLSQPLFSHRVIDRVSVDCVDSQSNHITLLGHLNQFEQLGMIFNVLHQGGLLDSQFLGSVSDHSIVDAVNLLDEFDDALDFADGEFSVHNLFLHRVTTVTYNRSLVSFCCHLK